MWIKLNDAEQKLAHYLARRRYENARSKGFKNKKVGEQTNEETDLEGIGAELAYCKVMNIYPDLEIDLPPLDDGILPDGRRVDVKSTKYKTGHLLAVTWKVEKAPDIYVLTVGKFPNYRIAGMMKAEELLQEHRLKDFGHGEGFAAEQHELEPGTQLDFSVPDMATAEQGPTTTTKQPEKPEDPEDANIFLRPETQALMFSEGGGPQKV